MDPILFRVLDTVIVDLVHSVTRFVVGVYGLILSIRFISLFLDLVPPDFVLWVVSVCVVSLFTSLDIINFTAIDAGEAVFDEAFFRPPFNHALSGDV